MRLTLLDMTLELHTFLGELCGVYGTFLLSMFHLLDGLCMIQYTRLQQFTISIVF